MSTTPEVGCYVDGLWGQYGIARAVKVALGFGWEDPEAADLATRHLAAMGPSAEPHLSSDECERLDEAASDAEDWLNDNVTVEGHSWYWHDGEFGLYANEEEE